MKKVLYLLFLGTITLSGCYYDNEEDLYRDSSTSITDTGAVSYSATIAPMMATNCTTPGCHAASGQSPNLTTYQGVSDNSGIVMARAVNANPTPMPAAGLMSPSDRDKLKRWIDAGALNN
jgi:hypothetical protein